MPSDMNVEDTHGQAVEQAQLAVTRQGDAVRSLKASVKENKATKVAICGIRALTHPLAT